MSHRRFYHAGDRGDLIYALPAIRAAGGGEIVINAWVPGNGFTRPAAKPLVLFHGLRRLLQHQPYLDGVRVDDLAADGVNLNAFRGMPGLGSQNIAEMYCELLGVDPAVIHRRWLFVVEPEAVAEVVIHRSLHHHGRGFPWRRIRDAYHGRAVMIGTEAEHDSLRTVAGWPDLPRHPTEDLYAAAQVIAGSRLFIGNQSAPYAIAEGMKVATLQETCLDAPNCIFERPNARYFPRDGADRLTELLAA